MRRSTLIVLFFMITGTAVLAMLGTWQVQRLFWKEDLIARVEERKNQPPVPVSEILAGGSISQDLNYRPVSASGTFDHAGEVFYYATSKHGGAGWNVHTPLILEDGSILIVNRGFVPFDRKDPATRQQGQVQGVQNINGLMIVPEAEKPNTFVPENAIDKREFYWRDLPQMADLMRAERDGEFLPFFLDAGEGEISGGLPDGGTTIVNFPNNHLQYAVTWYGLALTLIGVGGYFLYSRRQADHD